MWFTMIVHGYNLRVGLKYRTVDTLRDGVKWIDISLWQLYRIEYPSNTDHLIM